MATSKTHLDEIVDYPRKVIFTLYENPRFVSLLLNIPNADLTDPDVQDAYFEHMFDRRFVEGTALEAESFCWIDTEIFYKNSTTKTVLIDILVGVHNRVMKPSNEFKTFGNRRDNLIREIDFTLRGNNNFGIGGLEPTDRIMPINFSREFAGKQICFLAPNFAEARTITR